MREHLGQDTQRAIVVHCIQQIPASVEDLIDEFITLALSREQG